MHNAAAVGRKIKWFCQTANWIENRDTRKKNQFLLWFWLDCCVILQVCFIYFFGDTRNSQLCLFIVIVIGIGFFNMVATDSCHMGLLRWLFSTSFAFYFIFINVIFMFFPHLFCYFFHPMFSMRSNSLKCSFFILFLNLSERDHWERSWQIQSFRYLPSSAKSEQLLPSSISFTVKSKSMLARAQNFFTSK